MITVYIRDLNIIGTIVTEMTHGAIVKYEFGGFPYQVLMSDEDYEVLDEMFFDFKEIE